jgi:hypothetical protein
MLSAVILQEGQHSEFMGDSRKQERRGMPDQEKEKRDFMRVPFNTEVEIHIGDRTIQSESGINISMRGLRASTGDKAPAAGAVCSARIILNASGDRTIIQADGRIVRSEEGSVAMEFTGLDIDSYHHLRQLIINNADDPEQAEQEFLHHWGIRKPQPGSALH